MRQFYAVVALVSGLLLVGSLLVVRLGETMELTPRAVSPRLDAPLSTRPLFELSYRRALVPSTLEGAVRLEPPVPLSVEVSGAVATVRPEAPLVPEASYTLIVDSGVQEVGGREARTPQRYPFRTRAPRLLLLAPGVGESGVWGRDNLWTVALDGSDPRQLTSEEAGVLFASASPDGDAIAYSTPVERESADRTRLKLVGRDGSAARPLSPPRDLSARTVAWSPRGELIVYERRDLAPAFVPGQWRPGAPRLWGARPDGTDLGPIWGRGEQQGELPAWAPDGARLAFFDGGLGALTIYNFTPTPLTIPLTLPGSAAWAPNSRRLAYVDLPDPSDARASAVFVVDIEAPTSRRITPPAHVDYYPAWAPDGDHLALIRRTPGGDLGVWLVTAGGESRRPLQVEDGWLYSQPVWAADGGAVYWSRIPFGRAAADWELWRGATDGDTPPTPLGRGRVVAWLP